MPTVDKSVAEYFKKDVDYFKRRTSAVDILWYLDEGKKKDVPVWRPSNGCHGVMHNFPSGRGTRVYSSLFAREDLYDKTLRYWGYLLDPKRSPWARALGGVDVIKDEKDRPLAFGITDMGAPTQLGVNLMIQSRTPIEHPPALNSFIHWVDNKFSEPEALWLSEHIHIGLDGTLFKPMNSFLGFSAISNHVSLRRIKEQDPNCGPATFAVTPTYTPCNAIWEERSGKKEAIFKLLASEATYTGAFKQAFAKLQSKTGNFKEKGLVSPKEAVTILNDNRKAWAE